MSNIYCTYLTCYSGHKLPPFYIGSSTVQKVENNYHGSVESKKYKPIWKRELKENPHLFKTQIISLHETVEESREKELKFQRALNVVESTLYINQSYASVNGYFGVVSGKDHPCYGKTGENSPMSKTFWAIDPEGIKYIATGIRQFAKLHNLSATRIGAVLKGMNNHHKNWTFGYTEESDLLTVVKREPKPPRDHNGKKHPGFDHSIYIFFNTETKETFEGYRFDFMHKYGLSQSGVGFLINKKFKSFHKWIIIEDPEQPNLVLPNNGGKNHYNFDHSIYKFFNTETQEIFEGHQRDFIRTYDLVQSCISKLVNNKLEKCRNWILVEKLS